MPRKLLIGAGITVAVLVAGVVLLVLFLPADRLARAAERGLESRLGREVRIGDVGIDLLPTLAVRLDDVEIGDADDADEDDYAAVESLRLRPRLLPLFLRRIVVDEVEIDRPRIVVHLDGAGIDSVLTAGAEARPQDGGRVRFAIDRMTLTDGSLLYRDAVNGTELVGRGWRQELELEGEVRQGSVARVGATGSFSFESLDLALSERLAYPLRRLRLAVEHDAELDRLRDRLLVTSLDAELQELELTGSGTITGLTDSDRRAVAFDLETGDTGAEAFFRSLPQALVARLIPGGAGPGLAGRARIVARIRGPLPPAGLPEVDGTVSLAGVSVDRPSLGTVVEDMGGVIAFSLDSVAARHLTGTVLAGPATISATVANLAAPVVRFEAAGSARLAPLGSDSLSLDGAARYDLRGTLPLRSPGESDVRGTIDLDQVAVATAAMARPVTADGRLRFDRARITADGLRAALPGGRATVALTAADWAGALLGDTTLVPVVDARVRATTLDLDALLGPPQGRYSEVLFARLADRRVQGRTAEEMAEAMGLVLPPTPGARLAVELEAERLLRGGLALDDLALRMTADPDAIQLSRLDFGLMGGLIRAAARLEPATGAAEARPMRLSLDYALSDVGAAAFFDRFTPFRGHLGGAFQLVGSTAMTIDRRLLPDRQSLTASGTLTLTSGALRDWPVLSRTMDRLGLERVDSIPVQAWSADFGIAGPTIRLARGSLTAEGLRALAEGSFDFGGRLDLGATLFLSRSLAGNAAPDIARLIETGVQEVPLGLRITGTTAQPQIGLDLRAARDTALARARRTIREEAERAVSGAARRAVDEIFDRRRAARDTATDAVAPDTLPADSIAADSVPADTTPAPAAADSARSPVEGLFREGIRRLLPKADTTA